MDLIPEFTSDLLAMLGVREIQGVDRILTSPHIVTVLDRYTISPVHRESQRTQAS